LGTGENGRYITALTFGNIHGVYKPGGVKLRPELLKEIQDAVGAELGQDRPFDLVFHGGSGSSEQDIADAVSYGVIKMNVDTDTQYAFTRPVATHMFENYDGVLKVDGNVGDKKAYDPRAWGKAAEANMAARVVEACQNLGSGGNSLKQWTNHAGYWSVLKYQRGMPRRSGPHWMMPGPDGSANTGVHPGLPPVLAVSPR